MFTLDVELLSGLEIDLKVAVLLYSKLFHSLMTFVLTIGEMNVSG